ncbi:type II secretion system protein J [Lewinella sp. LCG006]|uniref:PulJ/GspJ family protein n=1 Tax=Lewinella sp. LCG006 TaxID=3231911 RepID=UPI00345F4243
MKRLAGFTLLEMMVVLTLTAVIVSLSFSGLRLIQLQFDQFKDQQAKVEDARRSVTLLKWDFARSQYIVRQGASLTFLNQQDSIRYTFLPSLLIRQNGMQHQDSFTVNLIIQASSFDQQQGEGLIDQVRMVVGLTDFAKTVNLNKTYSAYDLILWENEH